MTVPQNEVPYVRPGLVMTHLELIDPEHDQIGAAYRERLGRSVTTYFRRIPDPADHPVFRIEPTDGASAPIAERRRRP